MQAIADSDRHLWTSRTSRKGRGEDQASPLPSTSSRLRLVCTERYDATIWGTRCENVTAGMGAGPVFDPLNATRSEVTGVLARPRPKTSSSQTTHVCAALRRLVSFRSPSANTGYRACHSRVGRLARSWSLGWSTGTGTRGYAG